ncbi:hypothetical protein ACFE04_023399 [Oxalis oulophora]
MEPSNYYPTMIELLENQLRQNRITNFLVIIIVILMGLSLAGVSGLSLYIGGSILLAILLIGVGYIIIQSLQDMISRSCSYVASIPSNLSKKIKTLYSSVSFKSPTVFRNLKNQYPPTTTSDVEDLQTAFIDKTLVDKVEEVEAGILSSLDVMSEKIDPETEVLMTIDKKIRAINTNSNEIRNDNSQMRKAFHIMDHDLRIHEKIRDRTNQGLAQVIRKVRDIQIESGETFDGSIKIADELVDILENYSPPIRILEWHSRLKSQIICPVKALSESPEVQRSTDIVIESADVFESASIKSPIVLNAKKEKTCPEKAISESPEVQRSPDIKSPNVLNAEKEKIVDFEGVLMSCQKIVTKGDIMAALKWKYLMGGFPSEGISIKIPDKEVFGNEWIDMNIEPSTIYAIFTFGEIEASLMNIYCWQQHEKMKNRVLSGMYGFSNAYAITPSNKNIYFEALHLMWSIKNNYKSGRLTLVPYVYQISSFRHWVLIVIDPDKKTFYWMDPLNKNIIIHDALNLVKMALHGLRFEMNVKEDFKLIAKNLDLDRRADPYSIDELEEQRRVLASYLMRH